MIDFLRRLFGLLARAAIAALLTGFIAYAALRTYMPAPSTTILSRHSTDAQSAAFLQTINYDRSLLSGYWQLLRQYARGDWGRSWVNGESVGSLVVERMSMSVWLMLPGVLLAHLAALLMAFSRWRAVSWLAHASATAGMLLCVLLVQWLLCSPAMLGWFPAFGLETNYLSAYLRTVAAPTAALVLAIYGSLYPLTRALVLDPERARVMQLSKALGVRGWRLQWRGLQAISPALGARFFADVPIQVLTGSLVIELAFAVNAMGRAGFNAAQANDLPVLIAVTLVSAAVISVCMHISEFALRSFDPRMRDGAVSLA
jgi:peptide/nickel transport system permease protein